MQAVILAAGAGTRLYPLTNNRSKAMLPIVGKPILHRLIDTIFTNEITDIVVVINPGDTSCKQYLESINQCNLDIKIAYQQHRLGMANALQSARSFITQPFILTASDNLIQDNDLKSIIEVWKKQPMIGALLTLMAVGTSDVSSTGIVEYHKPWIRKIIEKPSLSEAPSNISSIPLYIFSEKIFRCLDTINISLRGEYELQDAIQALIDHNEYVYGHMIETRMNLTTPFDLLEINLQFLKKSSILGVSSKLGRNTKIYPPVYIEPGSFIGNNCKIGPNVYIEHGNEINNCVKISNSVLISGNIIRDREVIDHQIIFA